MPHFFHLCVLCQVCRFIKCHMLIFYCLAAFSFSPYIPSQINKSESFAFSRIEFVGLVSVVYVSFNPFLGGPSTISGVRIPFPVSIVSPFLKMLPILLRNFLFFLHAPHQIFLHGRSPLYNHSRERYGSPEMLSGDHPFNSKVCSAPRFLYK